jgi:O-antigen/teichoic acid export membrane protein
MNRSAAKIDLRTDPGRWLSLELNLVRSQLRGHFARNVIATFGTRIVLIFIGLVTAVTLARILGPEGRGFYAVAMAIGMLGQQFGVLGLHTSNTYFVAKRQEDLPALLGNTIVVSAIVGAVCFAGAFLAFGIWPKSAPLHGILLWLSIAWIPVSVAYILSQNLLLGIGKVGIYNRTELGNRTIALAVLGILVVVHRAKPELAFAGSLLAMFAMLALITISLAKFSGWLPYPSLALFKGHFAYGMRAYLTCIFCFVVIRSDVLMLKYFRGAETAGYYAIAVNMTDYIALLPTVIASLLLPKLSATVGLQNKFSSTKKVVLGAMAIETPLLVVSGLAAPWVVHVMFGKAFAPSVPAYLWLVPGMFFLSIHTLSVQLLNSIGCPMSVVWTWLGCAILKILLNFWAIPRYGISGAAIASSVCYFVAMALVLGIIRCELQNSANEEPKVHAGESAWITDLEA